MLSDLLDREGNVYINDVSIGTPDIEEHDYLLHEVFTRLKNHNF